MVNTAPTPPETQVATQPGGKTGTAPARRTPTASKRPARPNGQWKVDGKAPKAGEVFKNPVLARTWVVPRGKVMFLIGMSGTITGEDVAEAEFLSALRSVQIER